jgi:hypothetical protein
MTTEKKRNETAIHTEVTGIDEYEKTESIYFRHIDGTKVFSVSKKASVISELLKSIMVYSKDSDGRSIDLPLVFDVYHGNDTIFEFIQSYMEYFEGKDESDPPVKPLPNNKHISLIFQDEYKIFLYIVKENDTLKFKIETINKYIMTALYFDLNKLSNKLAAIVASLIKSKSLDELKTLLGSE